MEKVWPTYIDSTVLGIIRSDKFPSSCPHHSPAIHILFGGSRDFLNITIVIHPMILDLIKIDGQSEPDKDTYNLLNYTLTTLKPVNGTTMHQNSVADIMRSLMSAPLLGKLLELSKSFILVGMGLSIVRAAFFWYLERRSENGRNGNNSTRKYEL